MQHQAMQDNAMVPNAMQHSTTRHNAMLPMQHSTTQHNAMLPNAAQCNAAQCNAAQHDAAQHNAAQCNAAQCSTAQHSTMQCCSCCSTQCSTAPCNAAEHSSTLPNTRQHRATAATPLTASFPSQELRLQAAGKAAQRTAELQRDLEQADGMLRALFADVQALKDGRHPQGEQMYRRVYRLHERLVALRSEHALHANAAAAALRPRAEQQQQEEAAALRYVQELQRWVEENLRRLEAAEWGEDAPGVEAQLEMQRALHRDVRDFRAKIDRARADEVSGAPRQCNAAALLHRCSRSVLPNCPTLQPCSPTLKSYSPTMAHAAAPVQPHSPMLKSYSPAVTHTAAPVQHQCSPTQQSYSPTVTHAAAPVQHQG